VSRPLLCVDVDGVLSLFSEPGAPAPLREDTHVLNVEGIIHLIAMDNCRRLASLQDSFELVWATGWEDKANDDLLRLVGLAEPLEVVRFDGRKYDHQAHGNLGALDAHSGERPLAWIDDALDDACREWAASREFPTLLVETETHIGITDSDVERLAAWAAAVPPS
jgi:hypothetical protein